MNKIFSTLLIFCIISIEVFSHDPDFWRNDGLIISSNFNYDIKNNTSLLGLDLDYCSKYLISAGMNYQSTFIKDYKNQFNSYLGLCILNLVQAQVGYRSSSGDISFRLRSDIILFGDNEGFFSRKEKWGILKKGIAVSFLYEKIYGTTGRELIGIGIGVTL